MRPPYSQLFPIEGRRFGVWTAHLEQEPDEPFGSDRVRFDLRFAPDFRQNSGSPSSAKSLIFWLSKAALQVVGDGYSQAAIAYLDRWLQSGREDRELAYFGPTRNQPVLHGG